MKVSNFTAVKSQRRALPVLLAALVLLAGALGSANYVQAQDAPADRPDPRLLMPVPNRPFPEQIAQPLETAEATPATITLPDLSAATTKIYAPLIQEDRYFILADRIGFGTFMTDTRMFPDTRGLYAGWYVDWRVRTHPPRPSNIDFVQMVRLHQKLDESVNYNATTKCAIGITADRTICPYLNPPAYETEPTLDVIKMAAKRNPGAVWLIGNEMDRVDWSGGRQDEMTPELYAKAYRDMYLLIKGVDPTARLAIGGMIQFTPLREEYLNKVWEQYKKDWPGYTMPVDVWNIHNFIGSEFCEVKEVNGRDERVCYGMAVPPGASSQSGAYVGKDNKHTDKALFDAQIVAMRRWMKEHGQMNKPLLVTEYGVLYPSLCEDKYYPDAKAKAACIKLWESAGGYVNYEDPKVVQDFMLWTFEYFMNKKDETLSGVDGGRLVQRWAWFSLEPIWAFNVHGALMNRPGGELTVAGEKFGNFALTNWEALKYP